MSYLTDHLAAVDRATVVADTLRLIDDEVSSKRGISGAALRGGYKVIKKLRQGRMIEVAVDNLLDEFTASLSDIHDQYREQDEIKTFDKFLSRHSKQAADALLTITDDRAKKADNRVLQKTYNKLRGQAEGHVTDALPGVGRLIDRHVPKNE